MVAAAVVVDDRNAGDFWRECGGVHRHDAGDWRPDAQQSSGAGAGRMGSKLWADDGGWTVVAAADLFVHSWRIAAHRVQHVVSVGPGSAGRVGLWALDICYCLPA